MSAPTANVLYVVDDFEKAVNSYVNHLDFSLISMQAPAFADVSLGCLRLPF